MNWFVALLAGIGFATLLAMGCAFFAIKVFPGLFEDMDDQTLTLLRIMTALMVLGGGRLAYAIVRKK